MPVHRIRTVRDYELASGLGVEAWLQRILERDELVPAGPPASEIDDIGRSVLRFEMIPVQTPDHCDEADRHPHGRSA